MPDDVNLFTKKFNNLIDEFTTYDQTVDVVSCWESIINHGYRGQVKYFDRFPNIPPSSLTPDFTVLFNDDYGLIFEVKRTFPKEDIGFKREIKQLISYDKDLSLKANDTKKRVKPTTQDIILLVSSVASNEIFTRFNKIVLESDDFNFKNNVIFMEYFYHAGDRASRYTFRKFMGENRIFRDDSLPTKKRLEYILGEQAKNFECYPKHFIKYKVNEVFCNDKPPELYMAVFLWTKVLYNYLSKEQKMEWKRGNPQKIQNININVNKLLTDLNTNYIPRGNIRKKWITDAFRFLEDADLAKRKGLERVEINFRNLNQMVGHRKYVSSEESEQEQIRDYGHYIADRYCKNILEGKIPIQKPKASRKKYKQKLIDDE